MTYATNIFYDHLLQVPDWETIPVEDAAQEVQRLRLPGTICRMGCDGTRLGLGADR